VVFVLSPALSPAKPVFRADEEIWAEAARRGLTTREGHTYLRPDPQVTAALRYSPEFVDALPVFEQVTCPMLIVLATKNLPMLPPELSPLMDAFRAGLRRDLAVLGTAAPHIHIREMDASHAMVLEQPAQIATLLREFVRTAARQPVVSDGGQ
jgi:pimeloyl-ACP methyl ester carboxylesterase